MANGEQLETPFVEAFTSDAPDLAEAGHVSYVFMTREVSLELWRSKFAESLEEALVFLRIGLYVCGGFSWIESCVGDMS